MRKRLTLIACLACLFGGTGLTATGRAPAPPADTGIGRTDSHRKTVSTSLPYFNDFNDKSDFEDWTLVNTNPCFSWKWNQYSGYEYTPCIEMKQDSDDGFGTASDNWAISPAFELEPGFTYLLKLYISNWFPAYLEVRLMSSTDISDPGTLLYTYEGEDRGTKEIEFEVPSSGNWHIALYDKAPWTNNGTALRCTVDIDNLSLEAKSNNAVPEAPGELRQIPGANGEISMSLTWTNPTLSKMGETLDILSNVQIFKDGTLAETIREDITPGARMTWIDPTPTPGVHTYRVIVSNSTGESDPAEVSTFIGIDDPGAPYNLNVEHDADACLVMLDWEAPEFGRRGGWFDSSSLSYRVVRQPGGKLLANNLKELSFEDEDLAEYGNYVYEVTARTDTALGGTAVSDGILIGSGTSLPIIEGWEDPNTYPTWEIVDNNADGHTIFIKHAFGHESNSCIGWNYTSTEVDVDESLYSAPVRLEKGRKYRASFWINEHVYGSFSLDFSYGKAKSKASQTNSIISYSGMTTGGEYAQASAEFEVKETGTYYFCLHLFDCSQHALWFDDFRIEEVVDKNMDATAVRNINNYPTSGDKLTTSVTYTNRGKEGCDNFKVQLIDDDGTVLGEKSVTGKLAAGKSGTAEISWTVPSVTGRFAIRGRVIMAGDKVENDNISAPLYLTVQEKGKRAVTIGTGQQLSARFPFDYYSYNFSQTIYHGEDLGFTAGDITGISFKVQGGMDGTFSKVPFRIFIGNTTENDMFKGWMPADYSMTKVFDGTVDILPGTTEIHIPFDTPFSYGGGNICLLVAGDHDPTLMLDKGYGLNNYVTEAGIGATRVWNNTAVKPDPANPDQTVGAYYSTRPDATFFLDQSKTVRITGTITNREGNPVEGVTVTGSNPNNNIKAVTDAEGRYEIPHFPAGWGSASLEANKEGYQTGRLYGQVKAGEHAVIDCNTFAKCAVVSVKGKVCTAVDNTTPVSGAKITAAGDNDLSAITDTEGCFVLEGALANKAYPILTIEADGYKPLNWGGTQFYDYSGSGVYEMPAINMTPVTAAPFSVTATDCGGKAEISWEVPVDDIPLSKCSDDIAGQFGGPQTLSIAHRYSPEDLESLGVDDSLLLKAIRFMPMCYSQYYLAIWQGPEGNESPVYLEKINVSNFKQWNEFILSRPYKIDPTKSLLVGLKIKSPAGSYPIGFDAGPLNDGGDVLFEPTMNEWSTAHEILDNMDYNWAIQAVFGNNPNSGTVPWIEPVQTAPAEKKSISLNDASPEDLMALNRPVTEEEEYPTSGKKCGFKMLGAPMHAPKAGKAVKNEFKGYDVYRLTPGQESAYMGMWTKVNSEPLTETSFTDETWGSLDDTPYRYAVVTYYGNPYQAGLGVTSSATFSDGIDKGHYSKVTVNVTADRGNADGAMVYLVGDGKAIQKTVESGKTSVTFDNVRFTDYTVKVLKPYYTPAEVPLTVGQSETDKDVRLVFSAPAPNDMFAVDYINESRLSWETPSPATGMDLDPGDCKPGQVLPSLNVGKETIIGTRLTPGMRTGYDYTDLYVDRISFYANAATTYYPVVWRHNLLPDLPIWDQEIMEEEHEIYREEYKVSADEVGTWVTVKLAEPVKLNRDDAYYIGYAATTTGEHAPFVLDDSGSANNEYMWYYDFSQKDACYKWLRPSMPGAWMVKAHLTDTPDGISIDKEPVKYDIYRLADSAADNEQSWNKINDAPLSETDYIDTSWKEQPDADYRYAVKAVYDADFVSAPALSKKLSKGKVVLVNVELSTDNGLSPAGAKITMTFGKNVYRAEADADGKAEIPEVAKVLAYDVNVSLPAYEEIDTKAKLTGDIVSLGYKLSEIRENPVYLEAVPASDNSRVNLTWREPGAYAPSEGWVHWDNGKPYGGYGTSTGFCAAAHAYTPEDILEKRMKEYDITKISIFPTSSKDNPVSQNAIWVAKIWKIDMNTGSTTEVASSQGKDIRLDSWNEIEFEEPYHINGDETLLIGYEFYGAGNAMGIDQGPCKTGRGDWANFGQGWITLQSAVSNFNYNNLIHVYMENTGEPSANGPRVVPAGKTQPVLSGVRADVTMSELSVGKAVRADHPQLVSGLKYPHKGYLLYRFNVKDEKNESRWTQLNTTPVSSTEFSDINWKNVAKGAYRWAVKAVYTTGNSEPEFSLESYNEDGSVSDVESIAPDGNVRVELISRDRLLVAVPADAMVNVCDAAGLGILSADIKAGENIIDFDVTAGIYMIRVTVGNDVSTFKIIIE